MMAGAILLPAWSKFHQVLGGFGLSGLEGSVWQLNGGRTVFVIASLLLFVYSILLMPFYMALYDRLKGKDQELARLGILLGIAAAGLFAAASTAASSVALRLGVLYGLAVTGQGMGDVAAAVDGMLVFSGGLFDAESRLRAISLITIGVALFKTTAFQRWHGWVSVIVGILFLPLTLATPFVNIPFLFQLQELKEILFVFWLLLVGFRIFRLSKTHGDTSSG